MKTTTLITFLARLPLYAAVLVPLTVTAEPGVRLQGSFSISAEASPNTGATFCGGAPSDGLVAEGHGTGFSTLGAFTFTLHKTLNLSTGEYRGCVVLTAPDGDTLLADYDLVQANTTSDFNGGNGSLKITGGTGRFTGASGTLNLVGLFLSLYPANSFLGGGKGPLQVVANYMVDGIVSIPRR